MIISSTTHLTTSTSYRTTSNPVQECRIPNDWLVALRPAAKMQRLARASDAVDS